MTKQEFINELIGLVNIINMNKDMFKEEYDKELIVAIRHIIKKVLDNRGGGCLNESEEVHKYRQEYME